MPPKAMRKKYGEQLNIAHMYPQHSTSSLASMHQSPPAVVKAEVGQSGSSNSGQLQLEGDVSGTGRSAGLVSTTTSGYCYQLAQQNTSEPKAEGASDKSPPSLMGPAHRCAMPQPVAEGESSSKRVASASPPISPREEDEILSMWDWDSVSGFNRIPDAVLAGDLPISEAADDLQRAIMTWGADLAATSAAAIVTLGAELARESGQLLIGSELVDLASRKATVSLPSLQAYARVWGVQHDSCMTAQRARARLCASLLAVAAGLHDLRVALPPCSHDEWCFLSTSILQLRDDGKEGRVQVDEHALNLYALQPHDLCLCALTDQQWSRRAPRDGQDDAHELFVPREDDTSWIFMAAVTTKLEDLLRHLMDEPTFKLNSPQHRTIARHRVWRCLLLLYITMGGYYMRRDRAKLLMNSTMNSGVHSFWWYQCELHYARIPMKFLKTHGLTINFDDMLPCCVANSSINGKAVNTGNMKDYMKASIIEELTGERHMLHHKEANSKWKEYARQMEWALDKNELQERMSRFVTLREYASSPPWMPIPTVGDHQGETNLVSIFHEYNLRLSLLQSADVNSFFAVNLLHARPLATSSGTWMSHEDTQVVVADTLFTGNDNRGHLHEVRGPILVASTFNGVHRQQVEPMPGQVTGWNKMWLFSVKVKPEGAGHFMKKWPLHEPNAMSTRGSWGGDVGMLGVLGLAAPMVSAGTHSQMAPPLTPSTTLFALALHVSQPVNRLTRPV